MAPSEAGLSSVRPVLHAEAMPEYRKASISTQQGRHTSLRTNYANARTKNAPIPGPTHEDRIESELQLPCEALLRRCDGQDAPAPGPHRDCYDNNAVFLYSAEQDGVLGLIQQGTVKTLVGLPPPSIGAQLERVWQAEFREK
jgi:hypothetical protein